MQADQGIFVHLFVHHTIREAIDFYSKSLITIQMKYNRI